MTDLERLEQLLQIAEKGSHNAVTYGIFRQQFRPAVCIDLLQTILSLLSRLRQAEQGWVSVSERLPEKGQYVFVYFANSPEPYADVWRFGANQYFNGKPSGSPTEDVTHWAVMIPPAPPQAAQEEK